MERRQESRFPAELAGTLTTFTEPVTRLEIYLEDVSEGGARLALSQALEPGAFARLEVLDTTLYCEVKYCNRRGASYVAGVLVERVLFGASHLAKLIERSLKESTAS